MLLRRVIEHVNVQNWADVWIDIMTKPAVLILPLALLLIFNQGASAERQKDTDAYRVEHGWPKLPDGYQLGFVSGVERDSHGHLFTVHTYRPWQVPFPESRENIPVVMMWDEESGEHLDSWGANVFRMPHGLSIDASNNVWLTDVGRNQVFKFSHDGQLLFTLGEDGVEGVSEDQFAQPTDIEISADGTVYISDGYVNCRVVMFTEEGRYLGAWGECGRGRGQFNIPHDISIDDTGKVYVADRENDRIQVFSAVGEHIEAWNSDGQWRPYGIAYDPRQKLFFVIDGGEQPEKLPDRSQIVILDKKGREVGRVGRFGNQDGQFVMGHDIAVSPNGSVYVVDVVGQRLQKFTRP